MSIEDRGDERRASLAQILTSANALWRLDDPHFSRAFPHVIPVVFGLHHLQMKGGGWLDPVNTDIMRLDVTATNQPAGPSTLNVLTDLFQPLSLLCMPYGVALESPSKSCWHLATSSAFSRNSCAFHMGWLP
jgi:hypothetical protein